ncbi:MAG: hypothetical protein ACXVP0_17205 [Bacteroidia bacterium]
MNIERKKLIFVPDGSLWWAKTHAMTPTIDVMDDRIRVYFSSLNEQMTGRIGFVDLDKKNPENVIHVSKEPVLDIGVDGTFDDNGVVPASVINYKGQKLLYYHGFQLVKKQVRFLMLTGLASSNDGGLSFSRNAAVPLLERNATDPFIRSLAHVVKEENNFKIWYNGVNEWTDVKGKKLPVGNVRYLESGDPTDFSTAIPKQCLAPQAHEFSLSRPYVFKHSGVYKMLLSCRQRDTDSYKLGYAESADGQTWQRDDERLNVSGPCGDWDSDMICYTSLITLNGKHYLFYNGNGFGATGFGYAEVNF